MISTFPQKSGNRNTIKCALSVELALQFFSDYIQVTDDFPADERTLSGILYTWNCNAFLALKQCQACMVGRHPKLLMAFHD